MKIHLTARTMLVLLIIGFVSVLLIQSYQKYQENTSRERNEQKFTEIDQKNNSNLSVLEKPVLTLKESYVYIDSFENIDYSSYILSAIDHQDGDLFNSVRWEMVSETKNRQKIRYTVKDSDGNISSQILDLEIGQ